MKVQDIMNMSLSTCSAHDRLDAVAAKMWEHDCGCLPVVDHDGRPLAMITDRDLCMAAFLTGKPLADLPVAHAMSKQLVSCRAQEDVTAAAQRMCKHSVRRIPVVDAAGKLMGLLSLNDLAAAIGEGTNDKTANIAANEALRVLAAVSRHRSKVPAETPPPAPVPTPTPKPIAQPKAAAAKGTSA